MENARESLCFKCGSPRVVSSVHDYMAAEEDKQFPGWVCKKCLRELRVEVARSGGSSVMFGCEGFINDYLTVWDEEEINQKLRELNAQLREKGLRTRFFLATDRKWPDRPAYVVADDGGRPEEAAGEAERVVQELCRRRSIPVLHERMGDAFRRGLWPSLPPEFESEDWWGERKNEKRKRCQNPS